jgi:hypothetical protein
VLGELSYQGSANPLSKSLSNDTRAERGSILILSASLDTGTPKQAVVTTIRIIKNVIKVWQLIPYEQLKNFSQTGQQCHLITYTALTGASITITYNFIFTFV